MDFSRNEFINKGDLTIRLFNSLYAASLLFFPYRPASDPLLDLSTSPYSLLGVILVTCLATNFSP